MEDRTLTTSDSALLQFLDLSMLNKKIKVFVINLDRSPDRLASISKNLNKLSIPFERISAVDGTSLDMTDVGSFAIKESIEKHKWITPAVIGCALSHYAAFKKLAESEGAEWALILEDDIEFADNVVELLNASVQVINRTDVFLLYFHGKEKSFSKPASISLGKAHAFHAAVTLSGGYAAGAYLVHRDVAKRLANYVFPVHISSDSWEVYYRDGIINGLWALLPTISRTSNFGSDIGYTRVGVFLRQLEKIRFFPTGFLVRRLRRLFKTAETKYNLTDEVPSWFKAETSSPESTLSVDHS